MRYEDIPALDIMVSPEQLDVLRFEDVLWVKVVQLAAILKTIGRQQTLVMDADVQGMLMLVRGIFSATEM